MNKKELEAEKELLSKPGDTIVETLEYYKMSQAELAQRMGKTPSKINDIISGKEPITVTTALQLEKVLGIDAQFWLNRETLYREKLSRIVQEQTLDEYKGWLNFQPLRELKKYGYLKSEKADASMIEECLKFYGVASTNQWQSMYVDQYASTNFRKSSAHSAELASMAAWLRIGEIEMQKLTLPAYDKDAFKQALLEIRKLVKDHPENYASQLQQVCHSVGVGVVFTISIPKAPISGAVRWLRGNPLIQLTDRHKSNDHFWFTFYHESSHILLHGKKDVFIEDFEGVSLDNQKEEEADALANKLIFLEDIVPDFTGKITESEVRRVARKVNTHPAMVIGRLQHLGLVSYSFGNSLKIKVSLSDMFNTPN
ncbi:HigA family addiction module antitoxin [Dyadobacter jiangsuensis]|uniref:HTH-type transcriptional regulator/antitoxin HigA n=1 Tax=Dyadobacter jiangsuensis TaxID=1591085 RepID=A0A2P8FVG6_9BACT|nr:HigA family addiction module antitoxin [Dyadobacter jiangsuensis]PSL25709.1 HTH-type transcriptional regulator/antitoxin HigA [Dyadobacter jiangsuensis]